MEFRWLWNYKCFPGNQESEQTETDGKILQCDKAGFLNLLHGLGLHSNEGRGGGWVQEHAIRKPCFRSLGNITGISDTHAQTNIHTKPPDCSALCPWQINPRTPAGPSLATSARPETRTALSENRLDSRADRSVEERSRKRDRRGIKMRCREGPERCNSKKGHKRHQRKREKREERNHAGKRGCNHIRPGHQPG